MNLTSSAWSERSLLVSTEQMLSRRLGIGARDPQMALGDCGLSLPGDDQSR
jgi:hypothetical protein